MSLKKIKNLINNSEHVNPYSKILDRYINIISTEEVSKLNNICLEIGSGSGNFLTNYATKQAVENNINNSNSNNNENDTNKKQMNFLGIDTRYKRLVLAAEKSRYIPNIFWCRSRAEDLINVLKPNSVDEIHIYFPDPWPKARHLKHRLLSIEFLSNLKNIIKPNTKIFFKTDDDEYYKFARENLTQLFSLEEESLDLYLNKPISATATEFEKMFHSKKIKIKYLVVK